MVCLILAATFAASAQASGKRYVAMGDSFASGHGTREYFHEECKRSIYSYPFMLVSQFDVAGDFDFAACSGAKTEDVIGGQLGHLGPDTEYVTISIGGNDIGEVVDPNSGMGGLIQSCFLTAVWNPSATAACNDRLDEAQEFIQTQLPSRVSGVLDAIRNENTGAPNAVIGVVLYPWLMKGSELPATCDSNRLPMPFGSNRSSAVRIRERANQTVTMLNKRIADEVWNRRDAGDERITVISPTQAFKDHAICAPWEWINGLSSPLDESLHPNRAGHRYGYLPLILQRLREMEDAGDPPPDPGSDNSGVIERVSVSSVEEEGNAHSHGLSISADGRYVAFTSSASNLVPGDTNGEADVFVRDRESGTIERVSLSSAGEEGDGRSALPSISAEGRYVAFLSSASNLVSDDTNEAQDVFVHDRQNRTTERVSVSSSGEEGNVILESPSLSIDPPSISADGRYVAFRSFASNLVPGDTNDVDDIFVRDRQGGTTERVSVNAAGEEGDGSSYDPSISADGRYVAFTSDASNLVPGDTNDTRDIIVRDRQAGTTERISVTSEGSEGNFTPDLPSISAEGRYVAFQSLGSNLVPGDTDDVDDIFVRDRENGTTERVSVNSAGEKGNGHSTTPAISADGRYVVFGSWASNLVPDDTNGVRDIFVKTRDVAGLGDHQPPAPGIYASPGAGGGSAGASTAVVRSASPGESGASTNGPRPSFAFQPSEGTVSAECSVDQGTANWAPCTGDEWHRPADDLADGAYTFRVRFVDAEDQATTFTSDFTVDTDPPSTTIHSGPEGANESTSVSFGYSGQPAEDVEGFICRLREAGGSGEAEEPLFASCPVEGMIYDGLADGDYTFEVAAFDAAGNLDPELASQSFTVGAPGGEGPPPSDPPDDSPLSDEPPPTTTPPGEPPPSAPGPTPPDTAPPLADPAPDLRARISPSRARVRRGRAQAFRVRVRNTGDAMARDVRVCVRASRKRLALRGKRCRRLGRIPASRRKATHVRVRVKPRARGRKAVVRLRIRAANHPNVNKRVRVRIRR